MNRWWRGKEKELIGLVEEHGSPLYVYNHAILRERVRELQAALMDHGGPVQRLLYALKANPRESLVRAALAEGVGLECVSPGEVAYAQRLQHGMASPTVLFTPNFAPRREYEAAAKQSCFRHFNAAEPGQTLVVTLDNMYPLQQWGESLRGASVALRLDPEFRAGHHEHVRTAGKVSKFGISVEDLPQVAQLAAAAGVHVVGLHAHAGSGIRDASLWPSVAAVLAKALPLFPEVGFVDIGGGLAVVDKENDDSVRAVDLAQLRSGLEQLRRSGAIPDHVELWMEPGRYLVAECGVLLAQVTQIKSKGDYHYVGVECGFNSLLRPILYSAHHHLESLSQPIPLDAHNPALMHADVVGMICESGDVLAKDRLLPASTQEGDVLLIATTGAYGHSMSMDYNMREPAKEVDIQLSEI